MTMQTSIHAAFLTLSAVCGCLGAQTLTVSRSPSSPEAKYVQSGAAFDYALVALRFEATGGDVDLHGFAIAPAGATFMAGVAALACWLDDGDGVFDAQVDTPLWSGAPVLPLTAASFPAVTIPDGSDRDIWVVASFVAGAGSSVGNSYSVAFGPEASVGADGAVVAVGLPAPQSSVVTLVLTSVAGADFHGGRFYVDGSGLTPPFTLTVDGLTRHYSAPTGPAYDNGGWGRGWVQPEYFLAEDHSHVRFVVRPSTGWPYWPDDTLLSVQLTTVSAGLQDLGFHEYHNYYLAYAGDSGGSGTGGCALGDAPTALLPLLAALTLLWRLNASRRNKTGAQRS